MMLKSEMEEIGCLFECMMLSKYGLIQFNDYFLVFNIICDVIQECQDVMFFLVDEFLDLMVVIGGFNFFNIIYLQEIVVSCGICLFYIDMFECIDVGINLIEYKLLVVEFCCEGDFLFEGFVWVGIIFGVLILDWVVEEVIEKLM